MGADESRLLFLGELACPADALRFYLTRGVSGILMQGSMESSNLQVTIPGAEILERPRRSYSSG